jgi:hypothetical protein
MTEARRGEARERRGTEPLRSGSGNTVLHPTPPLGARLFFEDAKHSPCNRYAAK